MSKIAEATIVHKLPGKIVPDEYIKLVRAARPTAMGYAGQTKSGLIVEHTAGSKVSVNDIKELMVAFRDDHLVMYFVKADKLAIPDDVLPFTITDGKDDPTVKLATFFEGDFDKYADVDGDHTPEANVYDAEIAPKMGMVFTENGGSEDKFVAALRSDKKFQTTICNYFNDRGVFVIVPPKGDPISFGKNDRGGVFEWGNVSDSHGFGVVATPAKESVVQSGFNFLRGKAKATTAVQAPPVEPVKTDPAPAEVIPLETKPKVGDPIPAPVETKEVNGVTLTKMFPPAALRGNKKAFNLWLRTFNCIKPGDLSEQVQKDGFVWVQQELHPLAQRIVKNKEQVEDLKTEVHKLRKTTNVTAAETTATAAAEILKPEKADTTPKASDKPITTAMTGKSTVREQYVPSVTDNFPTMSEKEKQVAMTKMAGYLAKSPQPTGLEIQKDEAKWALFTNSTGTTFSELMGRSIAELTELCDGNKTAVSIICELRTKIREQGFKPETKTSEFPKTEAPPKESKPSGGFNFIRGKSAA